MNVTRDVIHDLWPVYEAGEATADTRALVEEFLKQDPQFAELLRNRGDAMLHMLVRKVGPDQEARALHRTKRLLHGRDWLLFFAILFSCLAFGRIVADTSWDVSPVNFIVMATIAGVFWIGFFTRLVWIRKRIYARQSEPGHGASSGPTVRP
jgi:hypothetical protein